MLVDGYEHVGRLHDGDGCSAFGQAEIVDCLVGDRSGDLGTVGDFDGHMAVHGTLFNLGDGSGELVAGRDGSNALIAGSYKDVGCLDDGDGFFAFGKAEILDCLHGDVALDGLIADLDGYDAVHGTFLDGGYGACELITCRNFHSVLLFLCAPLTGGVALLDDGFHCTGFYADCKNLRKTVGNSIRFAPFHAKPYYTETRIKRRSLVFTQKALGADDVAQMLDVSKNTVYGLAKEGKLASYKVGRKLRFTVDDVQAYIAESRQRPSDGSLRVAFESQRSELREAPWIPPVAGIGNRIPRTASEAFLLGGSDAMVDGLSSCLAEMGVHVVRSYQNSYQALVDLYFGYLDAAAVSLWDSSSESCNLPYIKRLLPGMPVRVFQMGYYTQGLLVQRGNPRNLRSWSDLVHSGAVLANREKGSAARVLLDERLRLMEADPKTIAGYDRELSSALVQGSLIARKDADVGIGTEKVYHQVKGLDYLPLQTEQIVLVVAKKPSSERVMRTVQQTLKSEAFMQSLASMAGYDFRLLGECIYET